MAMGASPGAGASDPTSLPKPLPQQRLLKTSEHLRGLSSATRPHKAQGRRSSRAQSTLRAQPSRSP
eukprot:8094599-Alexandrium_andersonii.AAC.1